MSDIAYTIKDLRRDGLDISKLTKEVLVEIFSLVDNNVIAAAETEVVLKDACNDIRPEDSVKNNNLEKLSDEVIEEGIKQLVKENESMITERKMGAMGPLMGKAMAKFKGKADGKTVSNIIKNEIMNLTQ